MTISPPKRIPLDRILYQRLSNVTTGLENFKCSKQKFEEYLRVDALHEQQEQVGQTWIFTYGQKIIGFVTISMAHVKQDEHTDLNIGTYGNIPALLIGNLATHRDYERLGVGRYMVSWVVSKGVELAETVGCRLVTLNPEPDVVDFYKKQGFIHVKHKNEEDGSMFMDIKQDKIDHNLA